MFNDPLPRAIRAYSKILSAAISDFFAGNKSALAPSTSHDEQQLSFAGRFTDMYHSAVALWSDYQAKRAAQAMVAAENKAKDKAAAEEKAKAKNQEADVKTLKEMLEKAKARTKASRTIAVASAKRKILNALRVGVKIKSDSRKQFAMIINTNIKKKQKAAVVARINRQLTVVKDILIAVMMTPIVIILITMVTIRQLLATYIVEPTRAALISLYVATRAALIAKFHEIQNYASARNDATLKRLDDIKATFETLNFRADRLRVTTNKALRNVGRVLQLIYIEVLDNVTTLLAIATLYTTLPMLRSVATTALKVTNKILYTAAQVVAKIANRIYSASELTIIYAFRHIVLPAYRALVATTSRLVEVLIATTVRMLNSRLVTFSVRFLESVLNRIATHLDNPKVSISILSSILVTLAVATPLPVSSMLWFLGMGLAATHTVSKAFSASFFNKLVAGIVVSSMGILSLQSPLLATILSSLMMSGPALVLTVSSMATVSVLAAGVIAPAGNRLNAMKAFIAKILAPVIGPGVTTRSLINMSKFTSKHVRPMVYMTTLGVLVAETLNMYVGLVATLALVSGAVIHMSKPLSDVARPTKLQRLSATIHTYGNPNKEILRYIGVISFVVYCFPNLSISLSTLATAVAAGFALANEAKERAQQEAANQRAHVVAGNFVAAFSRVRAAPQAQIAAVRAADAVVPAADDAAHAVVPAADAAVLAADDAALPARRRIRNFDAALYATLLAEQLAAEQLAAEQPVPGQLKTDRTFITQPLEDDEEAATDKEAATNGLPDDSSRVPHHVSPPRSPA